MKNNQEKTTEYTYAIEFELIKTFTDYFYKAYTAKNSVNSSKLRRILADSDSACLSTRTYDDHIKLLNKQLNPVFQFNSKSKIQPLHTTVFYKRLPFFLCFDLYGAALYREEPPNDTDIESRKTPNSLLNLHNYNPASCLYPIDIHKLYMPSFFAPLFIGVIGGLSKEKSSWRSFRENVLEISAEFIQNSTEFNQKCPDIKIEINKYLPKEDKEREVLYTYWLEKHFPDELFDILITSEDIINHGTDRIFAYNLSILVSNLSNDLFLTRIRAKEFWQNLGNIIKAQNPNMLKEYEAALTKARTEEFKKLQDIFLQKNSIST